ncbi:MULTISPECIES: PLD nuclease N-terminal domain-containing protein [Pseudomonas]|uniref:Phospholipase D-nuclease N-terminal n=1 Tax=Pseudomonas asplenii TaxID=53407 RepID=A0A0M9GFX1_9PSED|nr:MULTISPECIES: PLD nuclease N-terminal domain-containing protein [Pseudomonas]KPA90194.1 Phospholipase D-nuclease N-terminal [Pseudomonas fuscovaginae]KPA96875.1 Phospholipase D-nuclease N-terminal [Pseudomonas fuscovaginae]
MQIEYVWIALAVVVLLVELWAIRSVLRSGRSAGTKGLWIVVLIWVPVLGLVLWFFIGPKEPTRELPATGQGRGSL